MLLVTCPILRRNVHCRRWRILENILPAIAKNRFPLGGRDEFASIRGGLRNSRVEQFPTIFFSVQTRKDQAEIRMQHSWKSCIVVNCKHAPVATPGSRNRHFHVPQARRTKGGFRSEGAGRGGVLFTRGRARIPAWLPMERRPRGDTRAFVPVGRA